MSVNLQINSLKNKSTMQKQVIVYRINAIPKGSVMTVTNDEKEILKRNTCGFFHEEIFSCVADESGAISNFLSEILDYWDTEIKHGHIDKETFLEFLEKYERHLFAKTIQEAIQSDADNVIYDFSYCTI